MIITPFPTMSELRTNGDRDTVITLRRIECRPHDGRRGTEPVPGFPSRSDLRTACPRGDWSLESDALPWICCLVRVEAQGRDAGGLAGAAGEAGRRAWRGHAELSDGEERRASPRARSGQSRQACARLLGLFPVSPTEITSVFLEKRKDRASPPATWTKTLLLGYRHSEGTRWPSLERAVQWDGAGPPLQTANPGLCLAGPVAFRAVCKHHQALLLSVLCAPCVTAPVAFTDN